MGIFKSLKQSFDVNEIFDVRNCFIQRNVDAVSEEDLTCCCKLLNLKIKLKNISNIAIQKSLQQFLHKVLQKETNFFFFFLVLYLLFMYA